jgi:glycerol-3-phosphate dehydrogenase (NAD(P)+)
MQNKDHQRLLVIGAGSFGTAIAIQLAREGKRVALWMRDPETAWFMSKHRRHPRYLQGHLIPDNVEPFADPSLVEKQIFQLVLWAIPTQALRSVCAVFRTRLAPSALHTSLAKGFEQTTGMLPSQILMDALQVQASNVFVLSGPSFATEIAEGQFTALTLAGARDSAIKDVQAMTHAPNFRVYLSYDIVGLEIAGALKNVMALAAGACAGLGYKNNSMAALITRALAEIVRVGVAFGANPITFQGLGGVGDLFLTCTSQESRNFRTGYQLGQGKSLEAIQKELGAVAEGVHTSKGVLKICHDKGLRTPLIEAVHAAIWENAPIDKILYELTRSMASEEFEVS